MYDIIIIGAGPVGLACGIEAGRNNLEALILDKGSVVNSFLGYPQNMEFFSTPDLLEIGNHPFTTRLYKPTREEGIEYYRRVAEAERLNLRLFQCVKRLDGQKDAFSVVTEKSTGQEVFLCKNVVVATGFFDTPNKLNVPGEDLPKVTHYYHEPYAYTGLDVAVIGGNNSAAKAALACYRHGTSVTLVVRENEIGKGVKYWIRPDLINRIEEGSIKAFFKSTVHTIQVTKLLLNTEDGPLEINNDRVLALIGYRPDYDFLLTLDINIGDDLFRTPAYHPETFETNREGVYLAGTVCGGMNTSRWFIENGRFHAQQIMLHILGREKPRPLKANN